MTAFIVEAWGVLGRGVGGMLLEGGGVEACG